MFVMDGMRFHRDQNKTTDATTEAIRANERVRYFQYNETRSEYRVSLIPTSSPCVVFDEVDSL